MAQADFQNILVIHFGQLGDVVLGLPALKAVREHFSESKITVLSGRPTQAFINLADVADDCIAVDRVALRDGKTARSVVDILKLVKELRGRGFDLVIDLHSLYETNLLGYLSGARQRLYANRDRRSLDRLSNFPIKPPREDRAEHHTERYLKVLAPLGIRDVSHEFRLAPPADSRNAASKILQENGLTGKRLVGLFLGAGHESRRWQSAKFVETARELASDDINVAVLLGPEERDIRPGLQDLFGQSAVVLDEVPLSIFLALLAQMDVVVSGDTGPMHLAAVAGSAIVLLSQIGAPDIFHPLADELIILDSTPLSDISPDVVTNAVRELLSRRLA